LRQVLARLEDERTGEVLVRECHVAIPPNRHAEARAVAAVLGDDIWRRFPFVPGMNPVTTDPLEGILNNSWRPARAETGGGGTPAAEDGGTVPPRQTSVTLALRLPPTADAARAASRVKEVLEAEPPYGAKVSFTAPERPSDGWNAPPTADWLLASV